MGDLEAEAGELSAGYLYLPATAPLGIETLLFDHLTGELILFFKEKLSVSERIPERLLVFYHHPSSIFMSFI